MNADNIHIILHLLPIELWKTIYMVFTSTFFATLFGLPIGFILMMTDRGQIKEHFLVYKVLNAFVNIGRSFPFAILMVVLLPFTRILVGTSLGASASIVPLTVSAIPFVARLVETSLKEVDKPILEAAIVMGSSTWQIITKVLFCEALPSLVSAITLTTVNLIGYSTMAGLIGGGGLGQIAIQYGYHRFNTTIMVCTVILLIILVQFIQWIGGHIVHFISKKRGQGFHE